MLGLTFYQRAVSPLWGGPRCRFSPSCSQYSYEAVAKYGVLRGLGLSLRRLVRCHPFQEGGYDPIP